MCKDFLFRECSSTKCNEMSTKCGLSVCVGVARRMRAHNEYWKIFFTSNEFRRMIVIYCPVRIERSFNLISSSNSKKNEENHLMQISHNGLYLARESRLMNHLAEMWISFKARQPTPNLTTCDGLQTETKCTRKNIIFSQFVCSPNGFGTCVPV